MTPLDDLELFSVNLTAKRLDARERVFIFTSGCLRGELKSVKVLNCLPSSTYRQGSSDELESCVQLEFVPGPRNMARVTNFTTFNFSRKPQLFNIPVRAINKGFFLRRLEGKVWMLNVVTSFKG